MVYLDNSSTTKPAPQVVDAMLNVLRNDFGNPSSLHRLGETTERLLNEARKNVASLMGASPEEIYFTSGGTEANNWAIFGSLRSLERKRHIISSSVEHPSVLSPLDYLKSLGYPATIVSVDEKGTVDPDEVLSAVREDTALVSIMLVQNEIGTIEPCREIGRRLKELGPKRPRFHVDAVQGFAKLPIDVKDSCIDLLSISAHKIHGPKGIGALYIRKGLPMHPLIFGGGQEWGLRSGTENVPGIVGLSRTCQLWAEDRDKVFDKVKSLRKALVQGVKEVFNEAVLHGPEDGLAYIAHFSFPGFRGETILHALEKRDVFVSTGSACSSHKSKPSPVVLALGRKEKEALSSIRFSLSRYTTEEDIKAAILALSEAIEELWPWREKA